MKTEDKIELGISIFLGLVAIASLFIPSGNWLPLKAALFSLSTTGCFFFTMSFNQRHRRNKDT